MLRLNIEDMIGHVGLRSGAPFALALRDAMIECHIIAADAVRRHKEIWSASREVLRRASKEERAKLTSIYGSIARSVTDQSMSKVREKLLKDVEAHVTRGRAYKSPFPGRLKQQSPVVRTVVRTQTAMAFNAAAWSETSQDEDVWGYEYVTAQDERVRPGHRLLAGARYPRRHDFWKTYAPPNGWNCRCSLNVIYAGDSEARTSRRNTHGLDVDQDFRMNFGSLFID